MGLEAFDLGKHAVFIWSSYGLVAAVLVGLVSWLIYDGKRLQRRLDALAAQGVTRRSQQS